MKYRKFLAGIGWVCLGILALSLMACGGGGGGGDDGASVAWVLIDDPSPIPTETDMDAIALQGTAFVGTSWPGIDPFATGVNVSWENVTTGRSERADQWVRVGEISGRPDTVEHYWRAVVPLAEGVNLIKVVASDLDGNVGSETISIRRTAARPRVVSTIPADQEGALPVDTPIAATFNEAMTAGTINNLTFTLRDERNLPISGSVTYDNKEKKASFAVSAGTTLIPDTAYVATVAANVQDLPGNTMLADYSWRFTTGANQWRPTVMLEAPSGRYGHTAVWTGKEMIVWGGQDGNATLQSGGRYFNVEGFWIWQPTSFLDAPLPRSAHAAVWTGTEMLVWGGENSDVLLDTGGRYDPSTDRWRQISIANSPAAREGHTAIWTGTEMLVWGGRNAVGQLNTGGRYNPVTDSWQPISTENAPTGREGHSAVWTGEEMIIWGGFDGNGWPTNVASYNPAKDTWQSIAATGAPEGRRDHAAVWTDSELVIWGGKGEPAGTTTLIDGKRYDPLTGKWREMAISGAPLLSEFTTLWTGREMLVWGGMQDQLFSNNGSRYNPSFDSWGQIPLFGAPAPRSGHSAIWTGEEMIVWGGNNSDSGGRYRIVPSP